MLKISFLKVTSFIFILIMFFSLTAGNYNSNLLSGSASIKGGAQVSDAADGGALWYNPAGLGGINRKEFSLSGNGFMLRVRNNPNFMKTIVGTDVKSTESQSMEVFVIPSSVIMARSLTPNIGVAAGAFVPNMDKYDYLLTEEGSQNGVDYTTAMELRNDTDQLYYGLGLGWQIIPQLRVGFNLFGFYSTYSLEFATSAIFSNGDDNLYYNHIRSYRSQDIHGILGSLGLQWDITKNWHVGFRVTSPILGIVAKTKYRDEASIGIKGFDSDADSYYNRVDGTIKDWGKLVAPMNAAVGASYSSEKFSISAEVQIHAPMDFEDNPKQLVVNGCLGGEFQIVDNFSMGFGLFTDLTPYKRDGNDNEYMDYFGATLGGKYLSAYALEKNKKKDAIVFGTIVSIRYAVGIGKFGSVTFEPLTDDADKLVVTGNSDADFHEISVHLSSELYFW